MSGAFEKRAPGVDQFHKSSTVVNTVLICLGNAKFIISIETWTAVRKMRLELKQPMMDKYQVEALIF